ncbi:restriction endonuclease subunit S [Prevotella copri]|uniref:Restriction endonuclease subunit S n=1 Tax=Segatella copri TaxID=165179 RepID=A0AA91A4R9_9BACT|nr:restriction endonuclease subunit S [Segatella copri]MQO10613.1 restriction endonuclease subunit S [Segatella copri]
MDTKALRQKILDLAIHGKLVPQDPNDEPASVLLERIRAEKERLIKEGKIKKGKKSAKTSDKPHYPYELPKGWVWCKLDDIVVFQGGYAYKSNTYVNQSMWQVIRIGNVKNDSLNLKIQPVFVDEKTGKETQKYQLHKDDILFTMTGTKGKRDYFYSVKVQTIEKKLLLNQRVGCLRLFTPYINVDFLCLSLKCQYILDAIFSTETGNVSQGNIGSESTLNLKIAIPPFAEQCRIVTEVNKWYMAIEQLEQEKDKLQSSIDQVKSKVLDLAIHGKLVPQDPNDEPAIELLKRINPKAEITCDTPQYGKLPKGWCLCKISSVVDIVNGKSQKNVESPTGKYPIYGSGGIIGKAMEYTCLAGSTIIGRKGTINHPIFVEENFWNVDTAFGMKANNQILEDKYFYCFCLYFDFSKLDKSSALPSLTKTAIGNLILPIPPLAEQQRIVAKIEELFSQLDKIESSLQA